MSSGDTWEEQTWEEQLLGSLKGVACGLSEWSIPIAIAVGLVFYAGKGSTLRETSTDSLTGFRIISATLIVIEHCHKRLFLNGAGVFLVLSGCVISLSRRQEPGQLKSTFTSVREALKFIFVRVLRVVPLYWVYCAAFEVDMSNACSDITCPVKFPAQVLLNLAKMFFTRPWDLLVLDMYPNLWFVKTIATLYMLYPVLELAIFGRAGQLTRRRTAIVVVVCIAMKVGNFFLALWAFRVGREKEGRCSGSCVNLTGIWPCPKIPWFLQIFAELTGPIPFKVAGSKLPCEIDWYRNAYARTPEFVMGMLIPHVNVQSKAAVVCADIAALMVIVITFIKPDETSTEARVARKMHLSFPISVLIIWGLCFGPEQSRLGKVTRSPFLVKAGNFAYGVYVWQNLLKLRYMPAGKGLAWYMPSFPFFIALVYTVAWTTHRLVEEPVSDLARYLMGKASSRPAPPAELQGSSREGHAKLLETEEELSSDDTASDSSSESSSGDRGVCCKTMTS